MAKDKERRAQRRGGEIANPLFGEDLKKYEEQKRKIIELDLKTRQQLEEEYQFGLYCLDVRRSGLWSRDPANRDCDFATFLARLTGRKASRSTFDRRIRLVEYYTLERALQLHAAGVDMQAMVECTYGDRRLHQHLLEIALLGVPIWQIVVARQAGKQKLKEAKKRAAARRRQAAPDSDDPIAEAIMAMQQALLRAQQEMAEERARKREKAEKARKGKKSKDGSECPGGDGSGEDGADPEAALRSREAEVRERERAVALREQGVTQKQEELDKKAAELEMQRERLELRAEVGLGAVGPKPGSGPGDDGGADIDAAIEARLRAVKAEQAKLAEQQASLKEEKRRIAQWQLQAEQLEAQVKAGQAEVEAGREEVAKAQRDLSRRLTEAEVVAARLKEVEERERGVAAQAASIEQGCAAQMNEITARLAELRQQEAQIAGGCRRSRPGRSWCRWSRRLFRRTGRR